MSEWVISRFFFFAFHYHYPLCETALVPLPFQGHSSESSINGALCNCVRWDASLWALGQGEKCEEPDVPEVN